MAGAATLLILRVRAGVPEDDVGTAGVLDRLAGVAGVAERAVDDEY
jgi:hypothetical protein